MHTCGKGDWKGEACRCQQGLIALRLGHLAMDLGVAIAGIARSRADIDAIGLGCWTHRRLQRHPHVEDLPDQEGLQTRRRPSSATAAFSRRLSTACTGDGTAMSPMKTQQVRETTHTRCK